MKNILKIYVRIALFSFIFLLFTCSKTPKNSFSDEVLAEKLENQTNEKITLAEIYIPKSDSITIIDFWASWCPDCIKGLREVKEIQQIYASKNVKFIFLSVDDDVSAWKRSIEKHQIKGTHFRLLDKWKKSKLCDYLEVSWIPRYLVLDANGKIIHYNSIEANDKELIAVLEKYAK